jgi:hypothetical protein
MPGSGVMLERREALGTNRHPGDGSKQEMTVLGII